MKALVIGKDSMIGGALCAALKAEGTTRKTLDLATPENWPALPKADVAYICAAVSKLDACENNPEAARRVNVAGTAELARRLKAFTVFLSTSQVFDGSRPLRKAGDIPCPLNEYGRQKAEAEKACGAVLRLSKVIAPGDARIGQWRKKLAAGETLDAPDDIFLAPVTLENAIEALIAIKEKGIYQLSGAEDFSYYDLARALARHMGLPENRVTRGSAAAKVPAIFRTRYSSLETVLPKPVAVPDIDGIIAYACTSPGK